MAAYRLHDGLRTGGHQSRMLVRHQFTSDSSIALFDPERNTLSRLKRRWRLARIRRDSARALAGRPAALDGFTDDRSAFAADMETGIPEADVLHLHWVAGQYLDYGEFFKMAPARSPVVWTSHDMNAMTGGCHYDYGCGRFADECGMCPQLGSKSPEDYSHSIWLRKRDAFRQVDSRRLTIVAPSRWMSRQAARSPLLNRFPLACIPYGLNTDDFAPRDRACAREVLNLPTNTVVALFISDSIVNRRKGFEVLVDALAGLPRGGDNQILLVALGRNAPSSPIPVPYRYLGAFHDSRWLSLAYTAADFFVMPSQEDNLPNTVLESMACGTPVIGFDVGGIPDMVRPGVTGLLAPKGDVNGLRNAIVELIQNPALRSAMSANCRRIVLKEYTLELQARRYIALYEQLLGNKTENRQ